MNITYRQLKTEDKPLFADAIDILNRTQGRDLFAQNYLDAKTNNPLCHVHGSADLLTPQTASLKKWAFEQSRKWNAFTKEAVSKNRLFALAAESSCAAVLYRLDF